MTDKKPRSSRTPMTAAYRFTPEDLTVLRSLAARRGTSVTQVIRDVSREALATEQCATSPITQPAA